MIPDFGTLATRWRQVRFNPLRSLTPERLASALDSWEAGWLREAALIFETIAKRDAICKTVIGKRMTAVGRCDWSIQLREDVEETPEAEAHKQTLEFFYRNLEVTDATDLNIRTKVAGLAKQMMDAALQRYAAHEIVWRPLDGGLTAQLRRVPMYFFENRSGRLRFVGPENRADGTELDPNGWMITVMDGVGEALSICYMVRRLYMQDALSTSDKFAVPAVLGETNHKKDTPEGIAFQNAIANFQGDWVGVIFNSDGSIKDPIKIIESAAAAGIPQLTMIEYMDRLITILCRGGDLGTISQKDNTGASLQGDESDNLVADDCGTVTEVLNIQLDELVIRMVHGEVEPLARIVFQPPGTEDLARDLTIDEGLDKLGVVQSPEALAERYGREHDTDLAAERKAAAAAIVQPDPAEAGKPGKPGDPAPPDEEEADEPAENEAETILHSFRSALAADLQPLAEALFGAFKTKDGAAFRAALKKLSERMPEFDQGEEFARLLAMQTTSSLIEGAESLDAA